MQRKLTCEQDGYFEEQTIPFSQISNCAIDDENLSLKAIGLYSRIQRYITIPGFRLRKSHLLNKSKEGLRAFNSGWEELKNAGYLKQKRIRTENGFTYTYRLLNEPDFETPSTVNVRMDGTIVENYDDNQTTFDDFNNYENKESNNAQGETKVCLDIEVEDDDNDKRTDAQIETITNKIKRQIDYEKYKAEDNPYIDNLLNLMLEVATTKRPSIKVGSEKLSTSDLQKQCSQIDRLCIDDILQSLKDYEKPIRNPRAFLLKMLYNAPKTSYTRVYKQTGVKPSDTGYSKKPDNKFDFSP